MKKPHAVCVPFPLQGHINPMFKLAKLLHHKGFYITFVNTQFNHKRLLRSRGVDSFDKLPSFRFVAIDDGLSSSDENSPDIISLFHSMDKYSRAPFTELIAKHANANDDDDVPKVSCIIADEIMSFTTYAAQEFDIPQVILWCHNAFLSLVYALTGDLYQKGYLPLKDENLENHIRKEDIPVLKEMPLRYLPGLLTDTDPGAMAMLLQLQEAGELRTDREYIINTFEALEGDSLKELSSIKPSINAIGPLHLLEELAAADDEDMGELESSLWKEEPECLKWLDSKEPNSVIYINFGSISTMTPDQLNELAWGLANSKHNFLWIIRPDLVKSGGGSGAIDLQPDFFESTKERGMVATWCKQEKVLTHPSIGGFLTHNGWNSILESICCGVPMICLPFSHDQPANCWNVCEQWGIGLEITDVKRDVVERLLREFLTGDKGKEMKKKAMEWKNKAHDSAKTTSLENLEKLVDRLMKSPTQA